MTELAGTEITQPLAPEITGTPAQIAELYAALAAVQAELPAVKKNHLADMGTYSYYYADLDDVSDAIMPVLGKHGLAFISLPGHQPDGKFGLPYKLVHRSGASLEGFWAIPEQGGMQVIGGRITYARRYCLCAVTGITAGEDTDAREDSPARKPRTPDASPAAAARPTSGAAAVPPSARPAATPGAAPGASGGHAVDGAAGEAAKRGGLAGIIVKHFDRLGVTDRNDRLILTAQIARLDEVPSTTSKLTAAQQRDVVRQLEKCRNLDALQKLLSTQDAAEEEASDA